MSRKRNTTICHWLAGVALALIVVIPLSFGPAVWLADRNVIRLEAVLSFYRPLISQMQVIDPAGKSWMWYAEVGCSNGSFTPLIVMIYYSIQMN